MTDVFNGPLNSDRFVPFLAPNLTAVGAGGGPVFVATSLNKNLTIADAPAPVNLTALNETVPAAGLYNASSTSTAPMSTKTSAARKDVAMGGASVIGVLGALVGVVALF